MVYAYDQWAQMPVRDLYDSGMMQIAINAAKDMYDRGQQEIKDFRKEYGSFSTPSAVDQAWYNKEFNIPGFLDSLYKQGIDPLRSAEGRAAVQRYINSRDYNRYNTAKETAEVGKQYLKAAAALDAEGLYNPDMEKNYLRFDITNWDSSKGAWTRMSPSKYQSIDQIAEPIIKNVDYSYDPERTAQANDGNDYYTITKDRLIGAINDNMSDILSTPQGGYHYWKAMQAANNDPEQARKILMEQFGNRVSDHVREKFEPNRYKLEDYKSKLSMKEYADKAAIDHYYHEKEADSAITRAIQKERLSAVNIFREGEKHITKDLKKTGKAGQSVTYVPNESYYQYIEPVNPNIGYTKNKSGNVTYNIPENALHGNDRTIYTVNSVENSKHAIPANVTNTHGDVQFEQTGVFRTKWDTKENRYRYFIGGHIIRRKPTVQSDGTTKMEWSPVTQGDGNMTFYMEVKERDYNYGQKQKSSY